MFALSAFFYMKKTKRILVLLLAAAVVFGLFVLAANAETGSFSKVTLHTTNNDPDAALTKATYYFYPNHRTKTLIRYEALTDDDWFAPDGAAKTNYTCETDNPDLTITCKGEFDGLYGAGGHEPTNPLTFRVTDKDGNTETYLGYFLTAGKVCKAIQYPYATIISGTKENPRKEILSYSIGVQSGVTTYKTTTATGNRPDDTAKASKLTLTQFLGEITAAKPADAVTICEDKASAIVNWYQANGTIELTLGNYPAECGIESQTITVTDSRALNQIKGSCTNGRVSSNKTVLSGESMSWTAIADEGYKYKADSFVVKDALGRSVTYTTSENDSGDTVCTFTAPYGEVTVSAEFVPLGPNDKSNAAQLLGISLGGHEGVVTGSNSFKIEGFTAQDDLSKLKPVFTLSKGATVNDADSLTFTNGSQTMVIVRAEDGKHTRVYWVTPKQMLLSGAGTEEDPFLIESVDDFRKFVQMHPAGSYKQTCDLNLSGFKAQTGGAIVNAAGEPFKGVYDGGGHKITGLTLNDTNTGSNAALFHTISGTVKNLTIDNSCSFTARQWVGSFALYLKDGGKLDSCTNLASVTCKPSGTVDGTVNCFAGGLVALTDGSTWASAQNQIVNCRNDGSVTVVPDVDKDGRPIGNFASAGGLVGGPANVKISQSVNTGAVSNEASMQNYYGMDGNCTGGLVGQIDPNSAFGVKTEIIGCVNTGKVSGGCNVGGVAGKVNNKNGSVLIESCRNLGNVHATNTADVQNAGGILGCGYAEIYNCDSAGTITGETTAASAYRGAIAGYLRRENSVISRCFVANADAVVGGQANGVSYSGAVETKFIAASDVNSQTHIDELNAYEKPKSLLKITFRAPTAEETWAGGNYIPGEAETAKGYEAKLLGFAIDGHQAEIDEAAKTVTLVLPNGTALTSLTPTLTRSSGATYTPAGAQDFTSPVTYTVTSEDKSATATYTVTVTAASEASGLGSFAVKQGSTAYPVTTGEDGKKTVTIPASALASNAESALTFLYRTNSGEKATGTIGGTALTQTTSGAYDALSWPFSTATLTSGTKTLTMTFGGEKQLVDIVIVPELSSLTVKIADAAQRVTKTETGYKLDLPDSASTVSVTAVPALASDEVTIDGASGDEGRHRDREGQLRHRGQRQDPHGHHQPRQDHLRHLHHHPRRRRRHRHRSGRDPRPARLQGRLYPPRRRRLHLHLPCLQQRLRHQDRLADTGAAQRRFAPHRRQPRSCGQHRHPRRPERARHRRMAQLPRK